MYDNMMVNVNLIDVRFFLEPDKVAVLGRILKSY